MKQGKERGIIVPFLLSNHPEPTSAMTSRYLDPKIDLAFKRVFGDHAELLISFLNAMLPLPDDGLIESLEYLTPEQAPDLPGFFKNSIVDVKCTDTKGRIFIVEMQSQWTAGFAQRIVFSASQAYVKQLEIGQQYTELRPVYALALINQAFDHDSDAYYHHYQIVNIEHPKRRALPGLEFVLVEIPKFKPQSRVERKMQLKWLRFLSEVGKDDSKIVDLIADEHISKALALVERAKLTPKELDQYHDREDKARVEYLMFHGAKAEGMAEGMAEGKAQGKAEEKAEMIHAMHDGGMRIEQIASIAKLSMTQVQSILGKNVAY